MDQADKQFEVIKGSLLFTKEEALILDVVALVLEFE